MIMVDLFNIIKLYAKYHPLYAAQYKM
jgi:hypothetical protein